MLKKVSCLITALILIFSFCVFADEEFLVYGQDDTESVCNVLDMNAADIKNYCDENNITYLAVNSDNTKQIRRIEISDAFAQKMVDLSAFGDDIIMALSSEISGFDGITGTVIEKGEYKFLKVELQSSDSGGDYVLTQYTTVKKGKRIVLTFYTTGNNDRSYIENIFEEQFRQTLNYKPFVIVGVVLFAFVGVAVLVFLLRDFRKEKTHTTEETLNRENE